MAIGQLVSYYLYFECLFVCYLFIYFCWQMYASQYFLQISDLLRRLPRVILLMLKTNDCLRAVNNALVYSLYQFLYKNYRS